MLDSSILVGRDVTCLIPCKDGGFFLPRFLESLDAMSTEPAKFIFIDDGSTDGSFDLLLEWSRNHPVEIIRTSGVGLIAALNLGLASVDTQWVARFDVDDLPDPTRLTLQAKMVRVGIDLIVSDAIVSARSFSSSILGSVRDSQWLVTLLSRNPIPHSGVMFRREAVDLAGGYRAGCEGAEDLDLWFRMIERSPNCIASVKSPLTTVQFHRSSVSSTMGRGRQRLVAQDIRAGFVARNEYLVRSQLLDATRKDSSLNHSRLRESYSALDVLVVSRMVLGTSPGVLRSLLAIGHVLYRRIRTRAFR